MIDSNELKKRLSEKRFKTDFKAKERFFKLEPLNSSLNVSKKALHLETLSQIQRMCSNFEHIQEPIAEKPQKRYNSFKYPKKQLYEQVASEIGIIVSPKMKHIVSELKKRIKSLPFKSESHVSPHKFQNRHEVLDKLGPGEYLDKSVSKVESYEFSLVPRLNTPISHNISKIQSQFPDKKSISNEKIRYNKRQLKSFELAKDVKKKKFTTENNKICFTIERKKQIDKLKQKSRLEKLTQKFKLYEMRMMKDEVNSVKKAWALLFFVSGFSQILLLKGRLKKKLKSRWEVFLRKFVVISKFLAKFMIRIKVIRKRLLEIKLKRIYPAVEDYVQTINRHYKKFMQNFIEGYNQLSGISKLMVKTKFCCIKIQRIYRGYIKIKSARLKCLRILWNKTYLQYIKSEPEKTAALERLGSIKKITIDSYLEAYLKKSFQNYLKKSKSRDKKSKPKLQLYSNRESLFEMIKNALRKKESIIKKQKMKKFKQDLMFGIQKSPKLNPNSQTLFHSNNFQL